MDLLEAAAQTQLETNRSSQIPKGLTSINEINVDYGNDITDGSSHDLLVLLADNEAASALIVSLKGSAEILNAEKNLLVRQRDDARNRIGSLQDQILDLQKDFDSLINERETLESDNVALKIELAIQKELFSNLEQASSANIAEMLRGKVGGDSS